MWPLPVLVRAETCQAEVDSSPARAGQHPSQAVRREVGMGVAELVVGLGVLLILVVFAAVLVLGALRRK